MCFAEAPSSSQYPSLLCVLHIALVIESLTLYLFLQVCVLFISNWRHRGLHTHPHTHTHLTFYIFQIWNCSLWTQLCRVQVRSLLHCLQPRQHSCHLAQLPFPPQVLPCRIVAITYHARLMYAQTNFGHAVLSQFEQLGRCM